MWIKRLKRKQKRSSNVYCRLSSLACETGWWDAITCRWNRRYPASIIIIKQTASNRRWCLCLARLDEHGKQRYWLSDWLPSFPFLFSLLGCGGDAQVLTCRRRLLARKFTALRARRNTAVCAEHGIAQCSVLSSDRHRFISSALRRLSQAAYIIDTRK